MRLVNVPAMLLLMTSLELLVLVSAGSTKKGLGCGSKYNYHCHDHDVITNIAWWYDWRQTPDYHAQNNCTNPLNDRHRVPMVWGWHHGRENVLQFTNDTSRYVLGFNEPDHLHQSHLTPQQAAIAWRKIQERADRQNQLLVSPAATKCSGGPDHCLMPGVQWFTEFFQACSGCRVDFLATHIYSCQVSHVMDWLHELYERFHLKIWLTEVACPAHSHSKVLSFMHELLPRLEAAPYVFRYAWFSMRVHTEGTATNVDSLLHTNSATFTALGEYYHNFM